MAGGGCAALYLALVALLGLGVTAAVRDAAAAAGTVLGLLYLFPVAAGLAGPALQRRLEQVRPMAAGLDSLATVGTGGLPLTPWQGLGVAALWAAAALLAGTAVLLGATREGPPPLPPAAVVLTRCAGRLPSAGLPA